MGCFCACPVTRMAPILLSRPPSSGLPPACDEEVTSSRGDWSSTTAGALVSFLEENDGWTAVDTLVYFGNGLYGDI